MGGDLLNSMGGAGTGGVDSQPYSHADCVAEGAPREAVTASQTGAFVNQDSWLDAWTNWSAGSSGVDCSGDLASFPTTGDRMLMRADSPYSLDGVVYVAEGETLVIEPGVVVCGSRGGTLIVSRGGSIEAVGTADEPIAFLRQRPRMRKCPATGAAWLY